MRVLIAVFVAVLLTMPVAGEVVSRGRELVFDARDEIDGRTEATFTGGHARALREAADVDDDGDVNRSEGPAYERNLSRQLEQQEVNRTRLAGRTPTNVSVRSLELDGLVAATFSDRPINSTVDFTLRFPDVPAGEEIVLDRDVQSADAGPWRIQAPGGWRIGDVDGLANTSSGLDGREVRGDSDGSTPIRVVLVPGSETSTPLSDVASVVALVVAAAALRLHR